MPEFTYEVVMQTPLGLKRGGRIVTFTRSIDYSAFGMADEAGLDITLYSNKDVFHITGTICKPREGK